MTRNMRLALTVFVMVCALLVGGPAGAAETQIYREVVTSGGVNWDTRIGQGQAVTWTHDIPADILNRATRAGIIVGARDVDYPRCCDAQESCPSDGNPYLSPDLCEHDLLSVNGSQIGYLEGANNSLRTFEHTIPVNLLRAGENAFRVDADATDNPMAWVVWVKSSELYLYYDPADDNPDETNDFKIVTPRSTITVELGQQVRIPVIVEFKGACQGPVALKPVTTAKELTLSIEDGQALTDARNETRLQITANLDMRPGTYGVTIEGQGCGLTRRKTLTIRVVSGKLEVIKRQSQSTVLPGMRQIYEIEIINNGQQPATGLTISDDLDQHLSYLSDTANARHLQAGQRHTWIFPGTLKPDQHLSFTLVTQVQDALLADTAISNTAQARVDQIPESVPSNTVTAYTSFVPVAPDGLQVTKRVLGASVRVGALLTYTVEIKNTGLGRIFDLKMEDTLPQGFALVPGRVTRDGALFKDPAGSRVLRWDLGGLARGAITTLRYQVLVGANARRGQNRNTARVSGIDGGGNRITAEDSALVDIGSVVELGRIEAQVFDDHDGNGVQNAEDIGLAGIGLLLASGEKRITDPEGLAVFEDVRPGYMVVAVDERTLPLKSQLTGDSSRLIRVLEGDDVQVAFAVQIERGITRLEGRVFVDRNANGQFDGGESLVPQFEVELSGYRKTRGADGRFVFSKIEAGQYKLIVQVPGRRLETSVNLTRGPNEQDIPIPYSGIRIIVEERN